MRINKKIKFIFPMMLMALLFILGSQTTTVNAVPSTDEVYANAPAGLDLNTNIIDKISQYSNRNGDAVTNNAKFIYAGDKNNQSDMIQMMSDESGDQLSSFWGNTENNYFDLNKNQIVSAWIYMGSGDNGAPDGMAFVLQNDSDGDNAISRNSLGVPTGGETLGVWGSNLAPFGVTTNTNLQSGAIKNSFALELDSVHNKEKATDAYRYDDYFDGGLDDHNTEFVKGQHLAWNYPGDNIYKESKFTYKTGILNMVTKTGYYYQMDHSGDHVLVPNTTVSGYNKETTAKASWKHFVFQYTKPEAGGTMGSFRFIFNDKYSDGEARPFGDWDVAKKSYELDTTKFNKSNNKVRWGFTAGNGSHTSGPQTTAIVMEKMPAIANVETTVGLYDETQERDIEDLSKESTYGQENPVNKYRVGNGDTMRFDYGLTYTSGHDATGDITTKLELPDNVDFTKNTDGKIGQIDYKDKSVDITADNLSSDGKSLNLTLDSMDLTNNNTIKIKLYGKAVADSTSTKNFTTVNAAHTSFRSDNYTDDATTYKFAINNESLVIAPDELEHNANLADKVNLTGKVSYDAGSTFDDTGLTFHTKIDGVKQDNAVLTTTSGSSSTSFDLEYEASKLGTGTHKIEVYVTDNKNRSSKPVTYTVIVDVAELVATATEEQTNITTEMDQRFGIVGKLHYSNNSNFYSKTITMHYSIDDGDYIEQKLDGDVNEPESDFALEIPKNTFTTYGNHTIKAYATDPSGRKSNEITYNIRVIYKGIFFTPEQREITVNDNNDVPLKGNYTFLDNLGIDTGSGLINIEYRIKNQDEPEYSEVEIDRVTDNGEVNYNMEPIGKNQKSYETFDEFMAREPDTKGLKVGRNEVSVTLSKGDFHSETVTFIINVPEASPTITTNKPQITMGGKPEKVNYTKTFTYNDEPEYILSKFDLHGVATVDNGTVYKFVNEYPESSKTTPTQVNTPIKNDLLGIDSSSTEPTNVKMYFTDPYGRKTNELTYTVQFMDKVLSLQTGSDNYEFEDIPYNAKSGDFIKRKDKVWNLIVSSYNSRWELMAESEGLYSNDSSKKFNGSLVYKNEDKTTVLSGVETRIASGSKAASNIAIDVSQNWTDSDGILLQNNGFNIAGGYTGEIEWTLRDTP